jgi:3-hydroxyisobutyrate dehydrogenase-like beta-hydroxyacid dehydrogenase
MRIAFLGLGQMGEPMARRLLGGGHDVTVWNRTRERADHLTEAGARVARTPAEAVADVEVAITMLSTPDAVERVVFGEDGLAGALRPGQTLIEMSTIGPEVVRGIRERIPEGVEVVDAPVLGSVPQATDGTLRIFVGASDGAAERVRPVLEPMGTVIHVGGPGAGASMKLVANSTIGAAISAVGEALSLADAFGLRREQVLDILSNSPVGPTVSGKRSHILAHSYPPNFKLRLAVKDLRLVNEEGSRAGRELRIAKAAQGWFEDAEAAGHGEEDYSAVVETIAEA